MVNCKLVGVWRLQIWFKAKDLALERLGSHILHEESALLIRDGNSSGNFKSGRFFHTF